MTSVVGEQENDLRGGLHTVSNSIDILKEKTVRRIVLTNAEDGEASRWTLTGADQRALAVTAT